MENHDGSIDQTETRPEYTGKQLVFLQRPIAIGFPELLRRLLPRDSRLPSKKDVVEFPGGRLCARVDGRLEEFRFAPPFHMDSVDSPVLVEPERYIYRIPPPELEERELSQPSSEADMDDITPSLQTIGIPSTRLTGRGAIVAILDGGFDRSHPDFVGRIRRRDMKTFVNAKVDDDFFGHGTHCGGIIAGPRHPMIGPRYGVAPDVCLLVGRVSERVDSDERAADFAVIRGMWWASVSRGAHIISLSLGTELKTLCERRSLIMELITRILRDELGTIVIAATGNCVDRTVTPIHHPADCPPIVAVAAVDSMGKVAAFSCGSKCGQRTPTVSAPGTGIRSSIPLATNPTNPYASLPGTSAAAPHVAGVAALWVERTRGTVRGQRLIDRLKACVGPLPGQAESDVGRGLVKAP